jgi:hypothetical protein
MLATLALGAMALSAGCGGVDDRPADWGYISPALFQPNCATLSCHSPAAAVSGLDFSDADRGYTSLTQLWVWVVVSDGGVVAPPAGVPCKTVDGTFVCEQQLRPLDTPYDPEGSRVVNMLRARNAPRMPPDRPLPEADIRLVERWILNGACRTGLSCNGDAALTLGTDAGTPKPLPGADAATDGAAGN